MSEQEYGVAQEYEPEQESSDGGWLSWIAVLVGINVLSYLFDWPFWVY